MSSPPVAKVRARIAYVLLALFAGTIALMFLAAAMGWASVSGGRFGALVIAAEASLLRAAMRFYY